MNLRNPLHRTAGRLLKAKLARRWAGPAVILLAAAVAIAPQLVRGNSCGHDFDFHLVSWFDALQNWKQGVFYPHWTPSANYGAGEPRFVFYPPLTWMLGATLGLVMSWTWVGVALTFLLLAGTGLATRALARQALPDGPATLAGCAALFSGYALFTAYERSAFAELAGGFWIPLLLLLVLRDLTAPSLPSRQPDPPRQRAFSRSGLGSMLLLALVIAGAWLSNAPVGVMASYLLAAVALTIALLAKSWIPLLRAVGGATLGMGLAAFYLVPAAWEQRWVDIRQATGDPGEKIENSWLFARHAVPQLALHDVELQRVSWIAVVMIATALGGLLVSWLRHTLPGTVPGSGLSGRNLSGRNPSSRGRWWFPIALMPVVVLLLLLPVSLPLWNALPKLRFLQFPWRWLVALEAPAGIFFASAVWMAGRWPRRIVMTACTTLFLASSAAAGVLFFQPCDDEDAVAPMLSAYRAGNGFAGTDEYAPPGADNTEIATGLPMACLVEDPTATLGEPADRPDANPNWLAGQHRCEATFAASPDAGKATAEHLRIAAVASHSGYLIVRLRSYPAWRVAVNGKAVGPLPVRDDGLIAVPVAQGPVDLTVDWTTTADVKTGRWLSGISLALVTALWLPWQKRVRPRL